MFEGRRLKLSELEQALKKSGVSGSERKVVEYLAPLLERGPCGISNAVIVREANVYRASLTPALRRAIKHGFLCRDEATRPHTYWLPDAWLTT